MQPGDREPQGLHCSEMQFSKRKGTIVRVIGKSRPLCSSEPCVWLWAVPGTLTKAGCGEQGERVYEEPWWMGTQVLSIMMGLSWAQEGGSLAGIQGSSVGQMLGCRCTSRS